MSLIVKLEKRCLLRSLEALTVATARAQHDIGISDAPRFYGKFSVHEQYKAIADSFALNEIQMSASRARQATHNPRHGEDKGLVRATDP
ncbi:hypothetical protein BBBOND_0301510 [Babesia bigemina]|uniref:Uncharacterized protein n=1 Tax=Babesia bigemina TaxID=5866 RepID=A0A061D8E6_BABBI|nr:hypothetical protein BBBOND_0301510 [Babesia bigemina]CDR96247.1 hypothetical protein BBBOND_0301510 [Babesia bigemina]|eukprot:XP_012768433.1 hypothetical protein BBBOND_0301510 [Babesia bigemina]